MTAPFSIRRAVPDDRQAITAICHAIDPKDWVPSNFDQLVAGPEPAGLYVAEHEGRIIGLYNLELPVPGEAYFSAMRIDPALQGKGLGSAFCGAQVEHARTYGLNPCYLFSVVGNLPAHRTVMKNGFEMLGEWIVWGALPTVSFDPALDRARPATPADMEQVHAFLARHRAGSPLDQVICAPTSPWMVCTVRESDWAPEHLVLVEGREGLEGLMLLAFTQEDLIIRVLEGTPEAAHHLLAHAVGRRGSLPYWTLGLPARCEPLLAPLGLEPSGEFRAYVFRHTAAAAEPNL